MKIQGPSSVKGQATQGTRKSKKNSAFHTFLEAEIAETRKNDSGHQDAGQPHPGKEQAQLMEEAASLLDRALAQLEAGEQPTPEVLADMQQLRQQLHRQAAESGDAFHPEETMFAVEVERIRALNR